MYHLCPSPQPKLSKSVMAKEQRTKNSPPAMRGQLSLGNEINRVFMPSQIYQRDFCFYFPSLARSVDISKNLALN